MDLSVPTGKQARSIVESTARINIWDGAVRSGKTIASILRWLEYIKTGPPGNLLMVGKTERTLRRNILDVIEEIVGPKHCKIRHGMGEATILGRRIYLMGANDERAEGKLRGMTLAGAYGDELTLWPEAFFTQLLARLSVKDAKLFGTTNPDGPLHWLKKDFIDLADEMDLRRFQFGLDDNPNLDETYKANIRREYSGLWQKRMIKGLWCIAEGVIWDQLRLEDEKEGPAHVIGKVPRDVLMHRHWLSIDYGTANPFVALLFGLGNDDRLYILDEWRWDSRKKKRQLTDAQYSKHLKKWIAEKEIRLANIFVDPSALSFMLQLRRDKVARVSPADNTVDDGLRSVSNLLTANRLKILTRCKGLTEEAVNYAWDPDAQEKGIDQPLKIADHGPDALRYGTHTTYRTWKHWLRAKEKAA